MNGGIIRPTLWALVALCALQASQVLATPVTTGVTLPNGSFSTMLSGTGNAQLTGASGNYQTWTSLGFFGWLSTNTGVSASNQTVGISMPNVNINDNTSSGTANITYDNLAPGTPMDLNSLNADLNGAGGSNVSTPFTISVSPLTINLGVLGNASLALTVNGSITDATFTSTGGNAATPTYGVPGDLDLTVQGAVTGTLVNILGISGFNLSLGTLYNLAPTAFDISTILPGNMLLSDTTGGAGPYPATMGVDLNAAIPLPLSIPLALPFSVSESFPQTGHNNQFTSLIINAGSQLNTTLTLGNPNYDLNGTLPLALVPEPASLALASMALLGLAAVVARRKRAA